MTEAIVILLLCCSLAWLLGAFMMWRNMRPKLERARAEYAGMREAFQAQHGDKQKMFEAQQQIWKAYQELLRYKLNQP